MENVQKGAGSPERDTGCRSLNLDDEPAEGMAPKLSFYGSRGWRAIMSHGPEVSPIHSQCPHPAHRGQASLLGGDTQAGPLAAL